ncbi:Rho Gtpase-Activating Protein 26 [Manis pentadactyla]|nr:Rho Gtpase-Activating Protein 26 [Manis pentadactyla]
MMLLDLNELLVEGGRVGLGPTVLMASSRRTGPGVLSVSCSLTTVPAVSLSADSLRLTRQPSQLSKLPGCFPDSLLHSLEKLVTKSPEEHGQGDGVIWSGTHTTSHSKNLCVRCMFPSRSDTTPEKLTVGEEPRILHYNGTRCAECIERAV